MCDVNKKCELEEEGLDREGFHQFWIGIEEEISGSSPELFLGNAFDLYHFHACLTRACRCQFMVLYFLLMYLVT